MRQVLVAALLFLSLCTYGQNEPKNNLFKSLSELKQSFPTLKLWSDQGSHQMYTADGVFFEVKDNRVYAEFMIIDGEGFARDWYLTMRESFLKSNYHYIFTNTENRLTLFYSNFEVSISYDSYPKSQAMITYEVLPKYKW